MGNEDLNKKLEYCRILTLTTKTTYNQIGEVDCPILGEKVAFTAKGFHHLSNKPDGTVRDVEERIHKLVLVPLAVPVIKNCIGITEERYVEIRASRKKGAKILKGKTYTLVAKVGRKKPVAVRVILLRVIGGKLIFWSIMKD
ncbi:MAG: hypothetical protein Q8Q92_05070 [bacterium]|nr:hypothetical protein [bacterium]